MTHENGLSAKEGAALFGDIIQVTNHGHTTNGTGEKSDTSMTTEQIIAFESEESFLMKAAPMKPQHVAGTEVHGTLKHTKETLEFI